MSLGSVKGDEREGGVETSPGVYVGGRPPSPDGQQPEPAKPKKKFDKIHISLPHGLKAYAESSGLNVSYEATIALLTRLVALGKNIDDIDIPAPPVPKQSKKPKAHPQIQPQTEPERTILTNIPPIPQGPPLPWESESEQEQEPGNENEPAGDEEPEWDISDILPTGDRE